MAALDHCVIAVSDWARSNAFYADVLSAEVDSISTVKERVRRALRVVAPERLILNPDCGFAPASDNPISLDEAYLKLRAVATAAEEMRRELAPA